MPLPHSVQPPSSQIQPGSTARQSPRQPSPKVVLPSSQASAPSLLPSPHSVQGWPGTSQYQLGAIDLQSAAQPVPFVAPASHSSCPSTEPLPQSLQGMSPGSGQVQP